MNAIKAPCELLIGSPTPKLHAIFQYTMSLGKLHHRSYSQKRPQAKIARGLKVLLHF
jgi:hypothetical protein